MKFFSKFNFFQMPWLVMGICVMIGSCSGNRQSQISEEEKEKKFEGLSDEQKRKPENALTGLKVADGLQAELFASEPMMINPTNMDIDEKGRVWVIEVYNYRAPLNPDNPKREEGDRILILEDTNGDGKADNKKVFYQGNDINGAMGIWVMDNKVILAKSPNVFVIKDNDGDDKADSKEKLFTGMSGQHHDHGVHAFVFGPDGKYYFNGGNQTKQIKDKDGKIITDKYGLDVKADGDPLRQGMVFRCNPDGSEFEVLGHNFRNNYEVAVDSYGTLWQSDNDDDGNRGVRINYVMEFGNYGYRNEMTGAGWRDRRTNIEEDVPSRHWHQNDPGSIPNLLQTGAGSPTGILLYEGDLLPERFHNEMIHADAGPNVVRSYPVEEDGAGYKASINNILKGRDQWFRPSDVCVAPDGSLFVVDWYDPGVGGHQMGDQKRGRVFRIAPPNTPYEVPDFDFSTPEGAVDALKNPNLTARGIAWQKLHEWGKEAEIALQELWQSSNPREQARAFWLLAKMEGRSEHYLDQGINSENPDLRITALRAARQIQNMDALDYVEKLVNDPSSKVRREAAIALYRNDDERVPDLWAQLAVQHDGNDRWYLEALGIGAKGHWEACFAAWKDQVGAEWNTQAGRDIIWRSRAKEAIPMLGEIIKSPNIDKEDRLRYFRAFDFHKDPSKNEVLVELLDLGHQDQEQIDFYALKHMNPEQIRMTGQIKNALNNTLASVKGTQKFLDLVQAFELKDQNDALLALAVKEGNSDLGENAAKLLMDFNGESLIQNRIIANEADAKPLIRALGGVGSDASLTLLEQLVKEEELGIPERRLAVKSLGRGWNGENRLLEVVKNGGLNEDLKTAAASLLFSANRSSIRNEAAEYLEMPEARGGEALPPVVELVEQKGEVEAGKAVYEQLCQTCHQVNGEGTNFGPDLSEIGSKLSREGMYMAILNPDAGINFGYEGYQIKLSDGSQVVGYIASETGDAIEVRMPGGISNTYQKSQVESRTEMENSLMPSNLQRSMTEDDLVNLVEYLSSLEEGSTS